MFSFLWYLGWKEGKGREKVLRCRTIIHHISFASHFVFPFANLRKSILAFVRSRTEQNNFLKISETSCLPQKFSIFCSFLWCLIFFQTCFSFFCCIYFNMWFISDGKMFFVFWLFLEKKGIEVVWKKLCLKEKVMPPKKKIRICRGYWEGKLNIEHWNLN